jgi:hypothetical protein
MATIPAISELRAIALVLFKIDIFFTNLQCGAYTYFSIFFSNPNHTIGPPVFSNLNRFPGEETSFDSTDAERRNPISESAPSPKP